jgi:hypothetical protein
MVNGERTKLNYDYFTCFEYFECALYAQETS